MAVGSPVASLFVEFGSDTSKFEKGLGSVESGLGKVKSGLGSVITTAAGFAVAQAGIAGVGTVVDGVVGSAVNFDRAMRELNVLAGMGTDEYNAFSDQVLKVSSRLGVDATESVGALTTAIGSGVPKENIISFIENSTKAAIGGSADLGMVVSGTTGIIKAYGMGWESVNKVQDTFLQIADDGVTTVEELSKQMGGVAPIANAAGVSFEEMSAVYSTLTGVTGNTSEVTTQLKGALTSIIKPSAQASKLAEQMGLDFSTSAIESKGLAGFLSEVGDKAGKFASDSGMSTVDVLGQLFGSVEGLNAVLALTGPQAGSFGENIENIGNASGNVDAAFNEMNKSFSRMMEMGKEKVQALGIRVGMFLLPIFFSLGAKVSELASAVFPALMRVWEALQGPIGLVRDGVLTFIQALSGNWTDAEGIHPLHSALGNVGLLIRETVIPAFFMVKDAVVQFVQFALPYVQQFADWFLTVGLPAIINFAAEAQRIYRDVLLVAITGFVDFVLPYLTTFADWFIGTALPAIQNFATQAQELFQNVILPAIQTFVDTVLPKLIEFFNTLVGYIPTAQELGVMLVGAFQSIGETVSTVMGVVGPILSAVFDSIMVAATTIIPSLVGIWETLSAQWSASTPLVESLKNLFNQLTPALIAVGAIIGTVLVVAVGILMGVLGGLAGFLNGVLPGAIQVVTGAINVVSGILQVFSSLVIGIVKIVSALLHGEWGEAWDAAKEMVSGMASGVMQIISGLVGMITGAISGLVGGVIGLISGFIDSFIGFFQNLYHTLVGGSIVPDLVNDIITVISGLPGAVLGFISGLVTDAITAFTGLATDVIAKAVEIATEVPAKISEMATTALTNMGTFVTDMLTKAGEVVTNVVTEVTKLITEVPAKVLEMGTTAVTEFGTFVTNAVAKVAELPGLALNALSGIGSTLLSAGSDLIGGFIQGITDKIPDVQGALGGLTEKLTSWKGPPEKDAKLLTGSGELVMEGFLRGLSHLFPEVQHTLESFTERFADGGVKAIADAMSALMDATKKGVDALNALSELVIPSNDTVTAFRTSVEFVISELADISTRFSEETLEHAKVFGDAVGPLLGIVGTGVEGLSKIVEFVRPADDAITGFKFSVEHLLRSLGDTANTFSEEALAHARVFADTAGPMLSLLEDGVSGLTAMNDFIRPSDEAISEFKFSVEHLVRSLGDSAAMFSTEFLTSAKKFAETAGPVLELLSSVGDLTGVADFVRPADSAISEFKFSLEHLVRSIADSADMFQAEGLSHARVFAESAGPIVELLAGVPESFATLSEFIAPAEEGFGAFRDWLLWVVDELVGNTTAQFSEEGLAAASRFVDAGSAIVDMLASVPESFRNLARFATPDDEAFLKFKDFVVWIVDEFVGSATASFEKEGLDKAKDFVDAASKIVDLLGKGVEGVSKIGDFQFTSKMNSGLDRWMGFIRVAMSKLTEVSKTFDAEGMEQANAFAGTAKTVMDIIGNASDFSGLGEFGKAINAGIDSFFDAIRLAITKLQELGAELESGLEEAAAIAEKVSSIVELLSPVGGSDSGSGSGSGGSGSGSGGGPTGGTLSAWLKSGMKQVGDFGLTDKFGNPLGGSVPATVGATPVGGDAFQTASVGASETNVTVVVNNSYQLNGRELTREVARQIKKEVTVNQ